MNDICFKSVKNLFGKVFARATDNYIFTIDDHNEIFIYSKNGKIKDNFKLDHLPKIKVLDIIFSKFLIDYIFIINSEKHDYLTFVNNQSLTVEIPKNSTCFTVYKENYVFIGYYNGKIMCIYSKNILSTSKKVLISTNDNNLREFEKSCIKNEYGSKDIIPAFIYADFNSPIIFIAFLDSINYLLVVFKDGSIKMIEVHSKEVKNCYQSNNNSINTIHCKYILSTSLFVVLTQKYNVNSQIIIYKINFPIEYSSYFSLIAIPVVKISLDSLNNPRNSTDCEIKQLETFDDMFVVLLSIGSETSQNYFFVLNIDIFLRNFKINDICINYDKNDIIYEKEYPFMCFIKIDDQAESFYVSMASSYLKDIPKNIQKKYFYEENIFDFELDFVLANCGLIYNQINLDRLSLLSQKIMNIYQECEEISDNDIENIFEITNNKYFLTQNTYVQALFFSKKYNYLFPIINLENFKSSFLFPHYRSSIEHLLKRCLRKLFENLNDNSIYKSTLKTIKLFSEESSSSFSFDIGFICSRFSAIIKIFKLFKDYNIDIERIVNFNEFSGIFFSQMRNVIVDMQIDKYFSRLSHSSSIKTILYYSFIKSGKYIVIYYILYILLNMTPREIHCRIVKLLKMSHQQFKSLKSMMYFDLGDYEKAIKCLHKISQEYYIFLNQDLVIAYVSCKYIQNSLNLALFICEIILKSEYNFYSIFFEILFDNLSVDYILTRIHPILKESTVKIFWEYVQKAGRLNTLLDVISTSTKYIDLCKMIAKEVIESHSYFSLRHSLQLEIPNLQTNLDNLKLVDTLASISIKGNSLNAVIDVNIENSKEKYFISQLEESIKLYEETCIRIDKNTQKNVKPLHFGFKKFSSISIPPMPSIINFELDFDYTPLELFLDYIFCEKRISDKRRKSNKGKFLNSSSIQNIEKKGEELKCIVTESSPIKKNDIETPSYLESTREPDHFTSPSKIKIEIPEIELSVDKIEKISPQRRIDETNSTVRNMSRRNKKVIVEPKVYNLRSRQTSALNTPAQSVQTSALNTSVETIVTTASVGTPRRYKSVKKNQTQLMEDYLIADDYGVKRNRIDFNLASLSVNSNISKKHSIKKNHLKELRRSTRYKPK